MPGPSACRPEHSIGTERSESARPLAVRIVDGWRVFGIWNANSPLINPLQQPLRSKRAVTGECGVQATERHRYRGASHRPEE
jgi:hypothetical protein